MKSVVASKPRKDTSEPDTHVTMIRTSMAVGALLTLASCVTPAGRGRPHLGADAIQVVIASHTVDIVRCANVGAAVGTLTMQWRVTMAGTVEKVVVVRAPPTVAPVVQACFVAEIHSWTFPLPERPTEVVYPFRFSSWSPPPSAPSPARASEEALKGMGSRW
jgi:hypothetical protein